MALRVALYGRCSTLHQSTDLQLESLREYARLRDFQVIREYVDIGVSGGRESRPQLDKLMADARARNIDGVLVYKLDRFARSLRHLVLALAEFESLGVAFISQRDNLDLTTPSGRLMFQIIGAMAEFERALIRERVKAGVSRAIATGRQWGRKPKPLDLSVVPAGATIAQAAALTGRDRETVRRAMVKARETTKEERQ